MQLSGLYAVVNIDLEAAPPPVRRFLDFLVASLDELDAAQVVEWLARVLRPDPS